MSRFTHYQVCLYERCFKRFATKDETVSVPELQQLVVRLTARHAFTYQTEGTHLFSDERMQLLFGPQLDEEQVAQLIYKYDHTCTGALNLEDFLEFLSDYEAVVDRGNLAVQAFEHFQVSHNTFEPGLIGRSRVVTVCACAHVDGVANTGDHPSAQGSATGDSEERRRSADR